LLIMWDDGSAVDAHHAFNPQGLITALIIMALLIVTAAIAAVVTSAIMRQAAEARRATSRKAIYQIVLKSLTEARAVAGVQQISAAERLVNALDLQLGPALRLAGGLGDPSGSLRRALKGRITDPPKAAEQVKVTGPATTVIIGTGMPASSPSASAVASGGGVSASVSSGSDAGVITPTQVFTLPPVVKTGDPSVQAAPPPVVNAERDMSWKEQLDAVQRSLDSFAAFWKPDTVEVLLKDAQRALLDAKLPPKPPALR
jgi:hypothetical protein